MKTHSLLGLLGIGLFITAACGKSDQNTDRVLDPQPLNSLSTVSNLAPGEACPAGGVLITSGQDTNSNGVLEDAEVMNTASVCDGIDAVGPPGVTVLQATQDAGPGSCPEGGVLVLTGPDNNDNLTLDADEVTATSTVCNGVTGMAGESPCPPVVEIDRLAPGDECEFGGVRVVWGADAGVLDDSAEGGANSASLACDGVLSEDEKQISELVCNGAPGDRGATAAIEVSSEPIGENCSLGGLKIETWIDENENELLDESEVAEVDYLCRIGNAVLCEDIVTDMDVWGFSARGVDLRPYTSSTLHWIGCPGNGCPVDSFYCNSDADAGTLQFGTTSVSALRALVDPGDAAGDLIPNSFVTCCSAEEPLDICNAPDSNSNGTPVNSVTALCNALGYPVGTILRQSSANFCPEPHSTSDDGQNFTSDYVDSDGFGAEYLCSF